MGYDITPVMEELSWGDIEKLYDHEWVQLVDYDWPEGNPFPIAGTVHFHARDRKEFDALSRKNPVEDAACVFVGKPSLPERTVLSANAMKMRVSG